jgi:hypothetical protein
MGMYPGGNIIKLTPSDLVAAAYTEGDIIFAKNELKNAVPSRGGCSLLYNVTMFVEGAIAADDLTMLFFDNSTDLGEPAADPMSDVTADEFRTASCIGMMNFNLGQSVDLGNGRLASNAGPVQNSAEYAGSPTFLKAASGETSIWVAMFQPAGTLDLTDTDSLSLTFGFKYLG